MHKDQKKPPSQPRAMPLSPTKGCNPSLFCRAATDSSLPTPPQTLPPSYQLASITQTTTKAVTQEHS